MTRCEHDPPTFKYTFYHLDVVVVVVVVSFIFGVYDRGKREFRV